jgi:hypothetical protein
MGKSQFASPPYGVHRCRLLTSRISRESEEDNDETGEHGKEEGGE